MQCKPELYGPYNIENPRVLCYVDARVTDVV